MKSFRWICISALLMLVSTSSAANWPHWRGPNYNGSSDEKNLPTKFSKTENVVWTADLPGRSASTPVIWEDKIFVSSTDQKNETLKAICIDRTSGKVLWSHTVGNKISQDYRSTYAGCSPVTNGKIVVFFYGNGEMLTCDLDGKKLWTKNFGPFAFQWTFASSPLLLGDKLYLQVLQRDTQVRGRGPKGKTRGIESYLLALDPKDGKTIWRHVRPSKAVAESREAFSSPVPMTIDGKTQLVVVGGDALSGHDPDTGKELWRWGTWNPERIGHWRLVPSPVGNEDVILACAPKRDPIYAVKTGGKGTLDNKAIAWVSREAKEVTSDVPTPAYADGDFFILSDVRKKLSRVEPKTGKVKWSIETPGRAKYEASPLVADGKIYLINFYGEVVIVSAKDGKIINNIPMQDKSEGSNVRSSLIASQGQLFVRTNTKLYCIGKK